MQLILPTSYGVLFCRMFKVVKQSINGDLSYYNLSTYCLKCFHTHYDLLMEQPLRGQMITLSELKLNTDG